MRKFFAISFAGFAMMVLPSVVALGQSRGVVPGTGIELTKVGDDFEDPAWNYIPNNPKSTEDINKDQNQPLVARPTVAGTKVSNAVIPTL